MRTLKEMNDISWLECISCGHKAPLYGTTKFTCNNCGDLYDVRHDYCYGFTNMSGAVKHAMEAFMHRTLPGRGVEDNSGVWRFRELIMPSLDPSQIVSLGEGVLPFHFANDSVRKFIGAPKMELAIIPEGRSETGSFKDFGGTVAISVAKASGIKTIGCASTGDTSAMAAAYAAAAGMQCVVLLPQGEVTDVQMAQPVAHGADVVTIPGKFDDCMRIFLELCNSGKIFPINSVNPTRIEGHMATVFLTAQMLNWTLPDAFVVPIGNGSNSSSVGKAIRLLKELEIVPDRPCKIIGVQSESANPLALSWEKVQKDGIATNMQEWLDAYQAKVAGKTVATAANIGHPVSRKKVIREIVASRGAVLTATEDELFVATKALGCSGLSSCPQTGTALAGLKQALARGLVSHGSTVVLVSTASSLKFPNVGMEYGRSSILHARSLNTEEVAGLMGI